MGCPRAKRSPKIKISKTIKTSIVDHQGNRRFHKIPINQVVNREPSISLDVIERMGPASLEICDLSGPRVYFTQNFKSVVSARL